MPADDIRARAASAAGAALRLAEASDNQRRDTLRSYARLLEARADDVRAANAQDVADAEKSVEAGEMDAVLLSRLSLQDAKLDQAVAAVRAVADLDDPVGRTLRSTKLDDGLSLYQVTVPIGLIACAFESRPDAAIQVASLAIRTGNAALLKGGKEASRSNAIVLELAREALTEAGLPADGIVPITEREELQALLELDELIDLVIPRGSNAFVRFVQDHTRIPVLGHADGVCHIFVDASADPAMAIPLCVDAKVDYPSACNAVECILVHRDAAETIAPALVAALMAEGVEIRGDQAVRALAPDVEAATDGDWGKEYGTLVCAMRVVDSLTEAIDHINRYGSKHTDAIVTNDEANGRAFVAGVDAAGVFVNASTRFSDGFRYGLGAEVGISTGKVHARGPAGLDALTTTKWVLVGDGHLAATYQGEDARPFKHKPSAEAWHDG